MDMPGLCIPEVPIRLIGDPTSPQVCPRPNGAERLGGSAAMGSVRYRRIAGSSQARRVPDTSGRGGPCVVSEVAGLAAERAGHAVGHVRVTAVQDLAVQVRKQVDDLSRDALLIGGSGVLFDRHGLVADVPAGRLGDLADGVGEGEQARLGQLVELV
jgi:hypothetical protein